MKRRGRVRRVAKWTGLVSCVLMAAAWAVSIWWSFGYSYLGVTGLYWHGGVGCGAIAGDCRDYPLPRRVAATQWHLRQREVPLMWLPHYERVPGGWTNIAVPLWVPFVLVAVPTAWLFWRDWRRARPGHCVCGYDLAGAGGGCRVS